ncbi:hypothetical protein CK203_038374 [Vitis vinifera]|uniref:Uncharacterized protein n=1 Tax=Vitis vinifera TaxID=29760 RepID=A0A438HEM7_VITVI|nr:hypothetical protein CK203_038374 [Vitis vinifera]
MNKKVKFVGVVPNENRLLPCTKECPDRWFEHAPPKLKAYDTVTIVLTIHSSLSCDDDYPYGGWAIISDKGDRTYLGLDGLILDGLQVCPDEEEMFLERPVSLLSKQEFRDRFHIPDNIPILLIDDEALSSVDLPNNMMYFTKEQFVAGLRLPIPSLFKQFFHFILICLHYQNELEGKVKIFFPYSFLTAGDWPSRFMQMLGEGACPSLQSLECKERRGRLVEWVDKASFTRLNKLFEIDAFEWAPKVFLPNNNLLALIDNPKSFIIPVFSRLAPPSLVLGEHFVLKDLYFYEVACLADSKAR